MTHDPLAPFRREPKPEEDKALPDKIWGSDEHRCLRLAIDALKESPDSPLSGVSGYYSTHALIPTLETVYDKAERELQHSQAHVSMTDKEIEAAVKHDLKLWEDARKDRVQAPDLEPER